MRSIGWRFAPLALVLAFVAGRAEAQQVRVPENVRVRLTLSGDRGQRIVGVVLPAEGDSLMVRTGDSLAVIPRARVRRVELRDEHGPRNTYRGMLAGFTAGAVIGAVAGLTCPEDCQSEMPLILGAAGGGMGAVLGGVIGSLSRRELWRDADAPVPAVGIGPGHGGGVALALSFRTR